MDLAFTPEEQTFRKEIRTWVKANLPAEISNKVHNAMRLSRDDMQNWAKILGKKAGSVGVGLSSLAAPVGTPFKSICLKKNALWPVRRGSSHLVPSWWRP